jgi:membrane-associated protein
MSGFLNHLLQLPAPLALVLIGLLVFCEAAAFIGFVLPGETAVLLGGVLASTGKLPLSLLLAVVILAAIAGDSVGFEVGRHFGPRVLAWRPLARHQSRLDGARESLRRRGGWAVFLGRFTAFLRAVMPGLAGLSRMPYRRFLVFNAAGGIAWGTGACLLGYFAGESYDKVATIASRSSATLLAVLVVAVVVVWHVRRRRNRRLATAGPGDGESSTTDPEQRESNLAASKC